MSRWEVGVGGGHRVYRVPGFLSSQLDWVPPPSHPQGSVASLPLGPRGGDILACWEGGGPNSDEGIGTLYALRILHNLSMPMGIQPS